MAYGFEISNNHGQVILDDQSPVMVADRIFDSFGHPIASPDNPEAYFEHETDLSAPIFVNLPMGGKLGRTIKAVPGFINEVFYYQSNLPKLTMAQASNKRHLDPQLTGYGLEVYDDQGRVTFTTSKPLITVETSFTMFDSPAVRPCAGSWFHLTPHPVMTDAAANVIGWYGIERVQGGIRFSFIHTQNYTNIFTLAPQPFTAVVS